jgi:hypothetical protein
MNSQLAVIIDETQFPEFVHELIDPRSSGADYFCERLLATAQAIAVTLHDGGAFAHQWDGEHGAISTHLLTF